MYDWPELAEATDAVWASIRRALDRRGLAAPERLARAADLWSVWRAPDLLLSETCGAPLVRQLRAHTLYVATPVYAVDGWRGPTYRSAIVMRRGGAFARRVAARGGCEGLSGGAAAINDRDSVSGFWSLASRDLRPDAILETGAHRVSARRVAAGMADYAAIDALCWRLIQRFDPAVAAALEVTGWTAPMPAPPFITAASRGPAVAALIADALAEGVAAPDAAAACAEIGLAGVERIGIEAYEAALTPLFAAARLPETSLAS
jgi:ABC-type phosphate/phosphonate transport system substrate-binding protein